jgi:hypothetical protein
MTQVLMIVASAAYVLLGILHGVLTLMDLARPRYFTPPDAALRAAMQASGVRFHPEINLWRAWMGFNLTHSLGLALFGGVFLYAGIFEADSLAASRALRVVAFAVSALYFVISRSLFFSGPAAATGIATACFAAAALF